MTSLSSERVAELELLVADLDELANDPQRRDDNPSDTRRGQWHCCDDHPIGEPWGWNSEAWSRHYMTCPKSYVPSPAPAPTTKGSE